MKLTKEEKALPGVHGVVIVQETRSPVFFFQFLFVLFGGQGNFLGAGHVRGTTIVHARVERRPGHRSGRRRRRGRHRRSRGRRTDRVRPSRRVDTRYRHVRRVSLLSNQIEIKVFKKLE